jgi:hypothetical protein
MEPERFWELMTLLGGTEEERDVDVLLPALSALPPEDMLAFKQRFEYYVAQAHRIGLWGAAYTINGGCSDDSFYYFCCWVVTLGRDAFERVTANPDNLADIVVNEPGFFYGTSGLGGVVRQAWMAATGRTDNDFYKEWERLGSLGPASDEGEDWDFDDDDEVWRRLPRLARMFLDGTGPDGK